MVQEYLLNVCSPTQNHVALKVLTEEIVTSVNLVKVLVLNFWMNHSKIGRYQYSTISKIKFISPKTTLNLAQKQTSKIGVTRGSLLEELFQHDITISAFFLVDEDGYLRECQLTT